MALHWAWSHDVQGTEQQYQDAGWTHTGVTLAAHSDQPIVGFGGSEYAINLNGTSSNLMSPAFPLGGLTDGIIQFRFHATTYHTSGVILRLYDVSGTVELLRLIPSVTGATTQIKVYSSEGGTTILRGTTAGVLVGGTQHVIAVRFKPNGATGDIQVSIDGAVENIVTAGAVGATSAWRRYGGGGRSGSNYRQGPVTVWDTAADDALTVPRWVALLKPTSDIAIGNYLDQAGAGAAV